VTSLTSARALKDAGLVWLPAKGDRFVIPDREMDGDVFVVSDMTIEAQDLASGQVLGFNGTTEWALDSVEAADVLWLPREGQLRAEAGAAFDGLHLEGGSWEVATSLPDGGWALTRSADAEEAYALALLGLRATTAAQLLPVAGGDLAALLADLDAPAWQRTAPDGVRTVADVVSGALGGTGADPAGAWPEALGSLLATWVSPPEGEQAAEVVEAGAQGVLVDLVVATWDVGTAAGREPSLHPMTVRRALEHVRSWPTSGAATDASTPGVSELDALLRLTGR